MTREQVLCELARDGAWTSRQLAARLATWACRGVEAYVARTTAQLRATAWTRHRHAVEIVRLNAHGALAAAAHGVVPQTIRSGELEHALGLAELRWRCGVPYDRYIAQDGLGRAHRCGLARGGIGLGAHVADGMFVADSGLVLCEYDHGRYTAQQVRTKLAAFRSASRIDGQPIAGAIWGAPTVRRAAWLRALGVRHVVVLEAQAWLA